ncbi:hypothetical protein FRC19_011479 [Serendipita sp. 401]|nr:hypothetical protein FRC19_011479 [Serendipita sp. 401]KAG9052022.1 hypothetical protein FS842_010625 [Serendipita sp. 407]
MDRPNNNTPQYLPMPSHTPRHLQSLIPWTREELSATTQDRRNASVRMTEAYIACPRVPLAIVKRGSLRCLQYLHSALPGSIFKGSAIPFDVSKARERLNLCSTCGCYHLRSPEKCSQAAEAEYETITEDYKQWVSGLHLNLRVPTSIGKNLPSQLASYQQACPGTRFIYTPIPPNIHAARDRHNLCQYCGIELPTHLGKAAIHTRCCLYENAKQLEDLELELEELEYILARDSLDGGEAE